MHINLDKNVTLEKAHNISLQLEKTAKNKIDALEHIVVHFGPADEHEEEI